MKAKHSPLKEGVVISSCYCLWMVAQKVKIHLKCARPEFDPRVGKNPWRREQLPTPAELTGEFHGQRSLSGYSPWGRKESDMTRHLAPSVAPHVSDIIWHWSLSGLLRLVWSSLGSFMLLWMVLFHDFYSWVIFHCIYVPHLFYSFLCHWSLK